MSARKSRNSGIGNAEGSRSPRVSSLQQSEDRSEEAKLCIDTAKEILAQHRRPTHLLKNRVSMVLGFAHLYLETGVESNLDRAWTELRRIRDE
jgi:hypothetical protein